MPTSTLSKLPTPDEIHAELLTSLERVAALKKLLRLSQRLQERQEHESERPTKEGDKPCLA
jgi:hypothetical protein